MNNDTDQTSNSSYKFRFLRSKHRDQILDNPENAANIWLRLIATARKELHAGNCDKAVMVYGNAFETAEIILSQTNDPYEVNRYIRTAVEFAYALRHCTYYTDLDLFVAIVKERLEIDLYPTQIKRLIKLLIEVAFSPLSELPQIFSSIPNSHSVFISKNTFKQNATIH